MVVKVWWYGGEVCGVRCGGVEVGVKFGIQAADPIPGITYL